MVLYREGIAGAVLLMIGDNAGAEELFRADLDRNPRNPRSLFGLEQGLMKSVRVNHDSKNVSGGVTLGFSVRFSRQQFLSRFACFFVDSNGQKRLLSWARKF